MSLGVIGGLGPMATAYFMELIIKMTKADTDQEHLEMIIYNCPQIPDRTAFILGKSKENPLPRIIELGQRLQEQQVDCIAIPCITAHYFHEEISREISIEVIHGIRESGKLLKEAGAKIIGIMATDGTIESGIFQNELEKMGMEVVIPDAVHQKLVMSLIYNDVKAGKAPNMDHFRKAGDYLREQGAQVIILGCTELSIIKKENEIGPGYLDAMEALARASILACGKEVSSDYEKLFVLQ